MRQGLLNRVCLSEHQKIVLCTMKSHGAKIRWRYEAAKPFLFTQHRNSDFAILGKTVNLLIKAGMIAEESRGADSLIYSITPLGEARAVAAILAGALD